MRDEAFVAAGHLVILVIGAIGAILSALAVLAAFGVSLYAAIVG